MFRTLNVVAYRMVKYVYFVYQYHKMLSRGRMVGRMNIEGLRAGSYWV